MKYFKFYHFLLFSTFQNNSSCSNLFGSVDIESQQDSYQLIGPNYIRPIEETDSFLELPTVPATPINTIPTESLIVFIRDINKNPRRTRRTYPSHEQALESVATDEYRFEPKVFCGVFILFIIFCIISRS